MLNLKLKLKTYLKIKFKTTLKFFNENWNFHLKRFLDN